MSELKAVNLKAVSEGIRNSVRPVSILWQAPDTIAFVAREEFYAEEKHRSCGRCRRVTAKPPAA
jgi:hypothetical protein